MFLDADFSKNGLHPVINKKWAFGLAYENLDATKSSTLNFEGIAVFDAANCKNSESLQQHITKIKFDAVKDGSFQVLKVNKDDYTVYEVVQEIECVTGDAQEIDVDIQIGSNHYLGIKNSSSKAPINYFNEYGDYGAGMKFVMLEGSGRTFDFPNSVLRVDFFCESERY